jgi:RimJ/RimL family protein N-acetyltransferase
MQRPFLIGPRLYLRAVELADAERLIPWVTHPQVRPFLRRTHPLNLLQEEAFIREVLSSEGTTVFVIVEQEGDRPVGVCGLHPTHTPAHTAGLGISIGEPDAWGRGLGREACRLLLGYAFEELNLHRVELEVYANNPRALACYLKVGFLEEGRRREAHFTEGGYVDAIQMGVLATEWSAD